MNVLIFIAILLILVLSHEFGHFIVAKLNKIRVDEFAFGFPPRLFSFKKGETRYSINLLPLGGYVKIFGENGETEENEDKNIKKDEIILKETITKELIMDENFGIEEEIITEKVEIKNNNYESRSFVNKPRYIQALVLVAGVVMNFLVAWLLLSVGFMSGLPSSTSSAPAGANIKNQAVTVVSVLKNSPAEKAGLKIGDKLISFSTKNDVMEISSTDVLKSFVKEHGSEEITVNYKRGPQELTIKVTPESNLIDNAPGIGISMDTIGTLKLPLFKALWEGLKLTCNLTIATVMGFYTLIHNALIGQGSMAGITGPIGIVGIVGDAAKFGFIYLLSFTALISINLAVINFIPFPALDGGRLLFLLIEKIKGSRIKPEIANLTNMIGFGLLMVLMVFITYHDIIKLF